MNKAEDPLETAFCAYCNCIIWPSVSKVVICLSYGLLAERRCEADATVGLFLAWAARVTGNDTTCNTDRTDKNIHDGRARDTSHLRGAVIVFVRVVT
mmetsp:Transcript_2393/g.3685  ORF Transcript_2393/g.3685 Transcript_2393/m.3685 type:complete len:97 (-) Transcript_2393:50-340(-)